VLSGELIPLGVLYVVVLVAGRHAEISRAIIGKNVVAPDGVKIGVDKEHDRARGFVVSPGGIIVAGKGQVVTE
jgi:glucose-1-phosphate adenylyltransferase